MFRKYGPHLAGALVMEMPLLPFPVQYRTLSLAWAPPASRPLPLWISLSEAAMRLSGQSPAWDRWFCPSNSLCSVPRIFLLFLDPQGQNTPAPHNRGTWLGSFPHSPAATRAPLLKTAPDDGLRHHLFCACMAR